MISPGWYPDPAAPTTRRYWNGEEWIGDAIGIDEPIPTKPPEPKPEPPEPPVQPMPLDPRFGPYPVAGTVDDPPAGPVGGNRPNDPPAGAPPGQLGGPMPGIKLGDLPGDVPRDQLATLGERLAARVLDILIVLLLNIVVNGYFVYQYLRELAPIWQQLMRTALAGKPTTLPEMDNDMAGQSLLITLIALALWFAYEVPAIWNSGQTLGKRLVGIEVRFRFGMPMTFGLSMRRWWVQSLTLLCWPIGPLLGLADALWCTWDPMRQCLHDKAVATLVVRKPAEKPAPVEPTADDDRPPLRKKD